MRQVIYHIPIPTPWSDDIPIYGFGMMLFVAFVVCTWLAGRRAEKEGIAKEHIQDLAIWLFVGGLVGSRITFLLQVGQVSSFWDFLSQLPRIWDGGVIFYGAAIGGLVGYGLAYYFVLRKHALSTWKLADIIAPSIAMGLCLGRLGCFLNGCCYGQVATCPHCLGVPFPLSAPSRYALVEKGYQTPAGFTLVDQRVVEKVDRNSPEGKAGLQPGDILLWVNEKTIHRYSDFQDYLSQRPVGRDGEPLPLALRVERRAERIPLAPYKPAGRLGFEVVDDRTVALVEPDSPASGSGLEKGDILVKIDEKSITSAFDLKNYLANPNNWPRGQTKLSLTVRKPDGSEAALAFMPWTLELHPTQLYESISMFLIFWLLTFFYPFRRHDGEVMVLLMVCYAIHRYVNELLRGDPRPVGFEWKASVFLLAAGLALGFWLGRQPVQYRQGRPA